MTDREWDSDYNHRMVMEAELRRNPGAVVLGEAHRNYNPPSFEISKIAALGSIALFYLAYILGPEVINITVQQAGNLAHLVH